MEQPQDIKKYIAEQLSQDPELSKLIEEIAKAKRQADKHKDLFNQFKEQIDNQIDNTKNYD